MDICIVGEPTSVESIGDMIKIGRRGAMSAWFTVKGKQGHSAYLHKVLNPMPAVALLAHRLSSHVLDEGTDHFDASTCSVVTIDTGNAVFGSSPSASTSVFFGSPTVTTVTRVPVSSSRNDACSARAAARLPSPARPGWPSTCASTTPIAGKA